MLRIAIGGLLAVIALSVLVSTATAQDDGPLVLDWTTNPITWNDLPNEDSYRIFGSIRYDPQRCALTDPPAATEVIEFDEILPAGTTSFEFPRPSDPRLTLIKSVGYTLEALAADGSRIDVEGFGLTKDAFGDCTPAELAAAGTAFKPPRNPVIGTTMLGLLLFGLATLGAGLALRKVP